MVYMVMMYDFLPGMLANLALFVNFFFTLGILTSFQAALTMSGLAGMVLSLGTSVDANVLIYERIKEEFRSGKGMKQAVAAGYSNAFSAIFDSNLTSIITGIILFNFKDRSYPWFCHYIDYRYPCILLHCCVHDWSGLRTLSNE